MKQAAFYPLPCPNALISHEIVFGPPDEGHIYVCDDVIRWLPRPIPLTIVRETPVADTFQVQVEYRYMGSGNVNGAVTTQHWRWSESGMPTGADFEDLEDLLDAFYGEAGIALYMCQQTTIVGYRWALMNSDGSGQVGEQVRYTPRSITMNGGLNTPPPQVACAVTEVTDVRRRWGRFYLPFLSDTNVIDGSGRIQNSACTAIAAAAANLLTLDLPYWKPVVYGAKDPSSLQVRAVRVDNVADVIRRRRYDEATFRATVDLE